MPQPLFAKIVDEVAACGETAWLHLFGEPLLDPLLFERMSLVAQKGIVPLISTNATLLDRDRAEMLVRSPAGIVILSVDAASRETYERVRRKGNFDATVDNVERFLSLLRHAPSNSRPSVVVQLIRMRETQDEIRRFRTRWQDLPVRIWVKPLVAWRGKADDLSMPLSSERATKEGRLCDWPWRRLAIQADGSVVPCCYCYSQEVVLGNMVQSGIREVWQGDRFADFRQGHVRGRSSVPLCRDCGYAPMGPLRWAFYVVFGQYVVDRLKLLRTPAGH